MPFLIRPGRRDDAEALPDIERDAGRRFLSITGLAWIAGDTVMPSLAHDAAAAAGTLWVAEDAGGSPVGFLSAERATDELHIWEMAVRVEAQGQGIGGRLLAAAAHHARSQGLLAVTLTTFRDVPWNAPLYARHGFRILDAVELGDRLETVLKREVAAGLPATRRCAMRLTVGRHTVVQPDS
jgi:GNAT superfamily N-acetyltransferase